MKQLQIFNIYQKYSTCQTLNFTARDDDDHWMLHCIMDSLLKRFRHFAVEDDLGRIAVNIFFIWIRWTNMVQKLPTQFCSKYSDVLHESMELKLRNGYILPVQFDVVKCELKGVLWFFKDLELEGGEILLFEYFGRFKFNVYIIGRNGSEINYPDKLHCLQHRSSGIGYYTNASYFPLIYLILHWLYV